ncbi:RE1-silencing transcription factor isoform X3 [Manduca sexta]|uniref:RE1-silencing transcription factor isoform X3 n=1 Tax=Manduca sexta TaxID=7130 RepID=UPI00188EF63D|nr:RE1-silencing transcription factor isoform X3 [Manduca sexta]
MESRKESLSGLKICRFCLTHDDTLVSLYKKSRIPKNAISLPLKILSCVSIEVYPSDKMPSFICGRCKFFMDLSYEFKRICRQADENILQYVQTGTSLESVSWPNGLNKIYREFNGIKPSEVSVVKTVIEGGATVQVTTHDESDTDAEDDENVYNIKVGDGSDEGSKNTCIKVITSSDKEETPKAKPKRTPKEEGCWPCPDCDCTYPLQQLLELHKTRKHRERTEECDQCGAKFYNKYDMNVHQLRHANELTFICTACGKKFKRLILLKRHEKLMHSDMPQQRCPRCPASFLSLSDLEAHKRKHIRVHSRTYECILCERKFPGKASLQRHKEIIHDLKPAHRCDYCPQRFTTIPKLARHVRTHAAPRSYPCKYCNKTFVKSHHYTRHLRMKHRETLRSRRGPFGEVEQFRCDQCDDSFGTQDELIYHSAIHATQNLICPLCQEKFDDVEAVTMHIKSHANGSEFMCDYCELIFTTKEKLDKHMAVAHDEEVREEIGQDESSMEMEEEEDDDDNAINVKEENGEMVVEINKADDFMLPNYQGESEEKMEDNTMSEDSEVETSYTELATVDPLATTAKELKVQEEKSVAKAANEPAVITKTGDKTDNQTASILRKVEEMKRKVTQQNPSEPVPERKEKVNNKAENANSTGSNDKSLRLLEKELQELKRTNTRPETVKVVTAKSTETVRSRRPQIHTSTPKVRNADEKKSQTMIKASTLEKKVPERRLITKENKEPKEGKDNKNSSSKDDKDKEAKEKERVSIVKNGTTDKAIPAEEGVRRSTRPSKIKDYAKMIRESSQASDGSDEDSDEVDDDDEEFKETERVPEVRPKLRRSSAKQSPAAKTTTPAPTSTAATAPSRESPAAAATPAPRKRGRPRKFPPTVPTKVKKEDTEGNEQSIQEKPEEESVNESKETTPTPEKVNQVKKTSPERPVEIKTSPTPNILVSPTGQTLKKVPVKFLPPGVKPLPLPVNARPVGSAEVCEMQIGKKMVKVQKIVMTKAEVEAMAKKGLVEMKDGTMVLKQGIKLPQQDPLALKSTFVEGEPSKESPSKKDKATPTRCDFGDDI